MSRAGGGTGEGGAAAGPGRAGRELLAEGLRAEEEGLGGREEGRAGRAVRIPPQRESIAGSPGGAVSAPVPGGSG